MQMFIGPSLAPRGSALQPAAPTGIERLHDWPLEAWHVALHAIADLLLDIGEMAVALRKRREFRRIELERGRRIDRVEPVLLVDRLAHDHAPAPGALFDEVVEPTGAHDVAGDAVHAGALRDRHLGLCDGAIAREVDAGAAEEV